MSNKYYKILFVLIILGCGFSFAQSANAATYYVNATGGDNSRTTTQAQSSSTPWLTLQYANDTASNGDTIHVAAGTYVENGGGSNHWWQLTHSIAWIADGIVIVRGTSPNTRSTTRINVAASGSTFTGFTFDANDAMDKSVETDGGGGSYTFTSCTFTGAKSKFIEVSGDSLTVTQSTFSTVNNASRIIYKNNLAGNLSFTYNAVNTNMSSVSGFDLSGDGTGTINISNNTFVNTGTPISLINVSLTHGAVTVSGNNISGSANYSGKVVDLEYLRETAPASITSNVFNLSGSSVSLIYVNPAKAGITISSNSSTGSGAFTGNVFDIEWSTLVATQILNNTITSANGVSGSNNVMYIRDVLSPTISGNTIDTSSAFVADIWVVSTGAQMGAATVTHNTLNIRGLTGYGIEIGNESGLGGVNNNIDNSVVTDNLIYGPGYWQSYPSGPSGGHAITIGHQINATVARNFCAGYMIGILVKSHGFIFTSGGVFNNIVINNLKTSGIYIKGTKNVPIYNNIIYNDPSVSQISYGVEVGANDDGGDVSTGVIVKNNIIWVKNTNKSIYVDSVSSAGFVSDYNLLWSDTGVVNFTAGGNNYANFGLWQGAGYDTHSISANPVFTNLASYDFTLQSTSPAIDAGTNVSLTSDYVLTPVPLGLAPEIGAYEYTLPRTPTIGTPSAQSTSSIRWNFTDNASDETGFKIYDSTNTLITSSASANLTYLDETGLSANTQYAGRYAVASNSYGNSASSTVASSTYTLANQVTALSSANTTDKSSYKINLTWTDQGQTGMKIEEDSGCDGYDTTLYDNTTTNTTSPYTATVSGNTCYKFRISSYNNDGTINSTSIPETTQLTTPPAQPTGLTNTGAMETSIIWDWADVTGATGYKVYKSSDDTLLTTISSTTSNWTQTPLTSNTSYAVYVRATNANGEGIASSPASAYTSANAPSNAGHSTITTTSINWTWTAGTGQKDNYAWTTTPSDNSGWITATNWNQTSLSPNTSYTVNIKSENQSSQDTGSISTSAYTLAPIPTNLSASSNSNSVTLSVDSLPNATSGSSGYYFSRSGANSGWIQTNSWTDTGLSCGHSYDYSVIYRNGDGTETSSISTTKSTSGCGGGGMPSGWSNLPIIPTGGFKFFINYGASTTTNRIVTLSSNAGSDVKKMAISLTGDFNDASQENYVASKQWDLCSRFGGAVKNPTCPDGKYIVYAQFYTAYGRSSANAVASSTVVLKSGVATTENLQPVINLLAIGSFTKYLQFKQTNADVKRLQIFLNSDPETKIANVGAGSPGKETNYFGLLTHKAVIKFQEKYAKDVLTPWGFKKGTGYVGKTTLLKINELIGSK